VFTFSFVALVEILVGSVVLFAQIVSARRLQPSPCRAVDLACILAFGSWRPWRLARRLGAYPFGSRRLLGGEIGMKQLGTDAARVA
jgi:hypothetical protein